MNSKRLSEIQALLGLLYEQKHSIEKAAILASPDEQIRLEQKIKVQLNPQIKIYEQEYWDVIANQVEQIDISEADAEIVVAEFTEGIGKIQGEKTEIIEYLQEILAKVDKTAPTASAKLKGIISSIPPFVKISYEAELDTEQFFNRYFPTFIKAVNSLKKH